MEAEKALDHTFFYTAPYSKDDFKDLMDTVKVSLFVVLLSLVCYACGTLTILPLPLIAHMLSTLRACEGVYFIGVILS